MNALSFPSNTLVPVVGMGATECFVSDRYPCTISRIDRKGKRVFVRDDDAKVIKGSVHDGSAEWEITPGRGPEKAFTLRKNGLWIAEGSPMKCGTRLALGKRSRYYDPHF